MAITYNAGTNTITVTGYTEGTPCNFTDIYNADVAGAWGVVTKQCTNQFCFDCNLLLGDGSTATWFKDINKSIQFNVFTLQMHSGGIYGAVKIEPNANMILGNIMNAANKLGKDGCNIYFNITGNKMGIIAHGTGNIKWYNSNFSGGLRYGCGTCESGYTGNFISWQNYFGCTLYANSSTVDISRPEINKLQVAGTYGLAMIETMTIYDSKIFGTTYGAFSFVTSSPKTIKNSFIRNCGNIAVDWGIWSNGNYYLINVNTDTWTFRWHIASGASKYYRQYEFDLKVIDKNNTAISGATVKVWDKDSILIVDTTTNASGIISTQTITRGYYQRTTGNTLQEASPHLIIIEKAGYTTYEADFTLEEKTDWLIALKKVKSLQIDVHGEVYNVLQPSKGTESLIIKV